MAEHEGWYVQAKVDISGLLQANKETTALVANLKKVDSGLSGIKPNESLAKNIKSADIATASYIERLKSAGKTYEADKQQARLYEEQIEKLTNRQKGLTRELENIASKSGKTSDAYQIQKARINQTATAINNFKKDLQDTQRDMDRVKPTAFNRLTSSANKAVQAGDKMKNTLHEGWDRVKGGAIAAGAGVAAFTGAAVKGAKEAGTLQQRYREINNLAVLGGEKQREVTRSIARMQEQGRNISIRYGKSQQEIAEGYEDLVKRGYSTKQALGALKTEVQASVASGDKFSDVTTVSSQVLDAFGMRANSTAKMLKNTKSVVNELAYSADATSTGFSDIGVAMSYVGSTAKANKVRLAETASALGVLSNNGLEADKAGTALRGTINGLTNQINNIGKKNSVFDKLGIKKSEMVDAHGNLKSLSHDMAVLYQHIDEHSSGGSEQNGFFRSIFGTTAMNGAMILAKDSKEVKDLTDRTEKAGKTGNYVAQLAAKNMGTAQGATASARQAMNAFKITIGKAVLPALNEASNALAKFLLSKDGKQFQKDVGGAIGHVANQLVAFIKWGSTHKNEMKAIGGAILAGYSVTKGLEFVAFLGKVRGAIDELKGSATVLNGISTATENLNNSETPTASGGLIRSLKGRITPKSLAKDGGSVAGDSLAQRAVNYTALKVAPRSTATGLRNVGVAFPKVSLARRLTGTGGALQSMRSAGGFSALSTVARGVTVAAGAGIVASSGIDIYKAITAKNPKSKFKHYGRALGSAIGGSIGLWFGGAPGAAVGALIGKVVGGWAGKATRRFSKSKFGKAVSHTFKQTAWSVKQDLRPLGRTVNSTVRSVNKSFKGMSREVGKDMRDLNRNREFRNFKNFIKSGMVAALRLSVKEVGTILKSGIKTATGLIKAISSEIKAVAKIARGVVSVISDIFHGRWKKAWEDAKGIAHAAVQGIEGFLKGLQTAIRGVTGFFSGTLKNAWNFISGKDWRVSAPKSSPNVKNANAAVARMRNGSARTYHAPKSTASTRNVAANNYAINHLKTHASGGRITTTHGALVGEAGPELAYKNGSTARLLGAHGPQITKVHAGEHILNARDTAKVMSGGLGNGTVLKGYANGTTGLGETSKNVAKSYKTMANSSSKTLNKLVKTNRSSWSQIKKSAGSSTASMAHKNRSDWSKISSQTQKLTNQTRKHALSSYSEMRSGVSKQMDNMHTSVVKTANSTAKGFGKAMDKTVDYAKSAMSGTMGEMNKGIRGIDKVLSQFGGNGQVIKPVHFAQGSDSNGRLLHNTIAMVNDDYGNRQEAVVKRSGDIWIPRGARRVIPMEAGDGVLNGTQTRQLANAWGLKHFAKGSGVSHSELKKIASRGQENPAKSFAEMFTSNIKVSGAALNKGTTNLGKNSATHYGNPWSTAMWQVINDAIGSANGNGGTREAFLKYAESHFTGVPYQMGAMSKRLSDCSGMVAQALEHFGIDIGRTTVAMQHSAGVQNLGKNINKTVPGDLVIFGHGTGAAGHVGIIKNPQRGTMFNETPPHARVTSIASDTGMGYSFYRVRGLHNAVKSHKAQKADSRLVKLAKSELGSSAIKWIKDHLGDDFGTLGNFKIGGDLRDKARALAGGLKKLDPRATKNGIAAVLGNWNFESGGLNPGAINPGGGASGLGQWLGGRKANLMAFARRHGTSWRNAGTQLSFAVKGEGSDSAILRSILEGRGSVASLANKFSAEWERGGYNAQHVAGAMQIRKALGFAKGGNHYGRTPFIAGEHGPELITANGPVHVDTHEQTKRKVRDLADSFKPRKVTTTTRAGRQPITININFNGNIGGSDSDMRRMANVARREVARAFEDLLDHGEGSDESIY